MNERLIAEMFRAAARGQVEPFHHNGARWTGNAYEVALSAAASFDMMAEVFEKAALASGDLSSKAACKQAVQNDWTYCPFCGAQECTGREL